MGQAVWNDIVLKDLLPIEYLLRNCPEDRAFTVNDPTSFIVNFC